MNADEARKLTDEHLSGPAIKKFVDYIDGRIERAAKEGKNSLHNPQVGTAEEGFNFFLRENQRKAVRVHYEKLGFDWIDRPDPDPGNPCSGPYTTLSW